MTLLHSIKGKFILLMCALVILMLLAIKFYFIPKVDHFLELSVEHEMKRNMESFEKVIHTVAVAANGERDVVRNALESISRDPEIPVVFRRSNSIRLQYGRSAEKKTQNSIEEKVFRDEEPIFVKTKNSFEYIYPLRAIEVCQTCHFAENGKDNVPLGYVLGLAVMTVPHKVLRENKLFYFVKDIFVNNLFLIALMLLIIFWGLWRWIFKPLELVSARVQDLTGRDEEYYNFEVGAVQHDEIRTLKLHIEELIKQNDSSGNGDTENKTSATVKET